MRLTHFNISLPLVVIGVDFYAELPKYLGQLKTNPNSITSLESLASYTQAVGDLEHFPHTNIDVWLSLLAALRARPEIRQSSDKFFEQFTEVARVWANEGCITGAMAEYKVDGFIMPSSFSYIFPAFGGMPVVTVTMEKFPAGTPTIPKFKGRTDIAPNVPIRLSFLGEQWSEEKLIGWAYVYEQKTQWRYKVDPVVKPKTQLWDFLKFGR